MDILTVATLSGRRVNTVVGPIIIVLSGSLVPLPLFPDWRFSAPLRLCGKKTTLPRNQLRAYVRCLHDTSKGSVMLAYIGLLLIAVQQPSSLTIGSAVARPGQAASGFIDVPAGTDSATRIPITIV